MSESDAPVERGERAAKWLARAGVATAPQNTRIIAVASKP